MTEQRFSPRYAGTAGADLSKKRASITRCWELSAPKSEANIGASIRRSGDLEGRSERFADGNGSNWNRTSLVRLRLRFAAQRLQVRPTRLITARLTHESPWKTTLTAENSRRGEMATRTDLDREARVSALLESWRSAYRQMRERDDPDAEKLRRDIELLEELAAERPAESKSSTSEG
jgi:hypothetical protein